MRYGDVVEISSIENVSSIQTKLDLIVFEPTSCLMKVETNVFSFLRYFRYAFSTKIYSRLFV